MLITLGDRPHTSTVLSKVLVVKGRDQYIDVIGRPMLRALKAVTSIYHQKSKVPRAKWNLESEREPVRLEVNI